MHVTCLAYLTPIILFSEYNSLSSSSCNFLQTPATSSLLGHMNKGKAFKQLFGEFITPKTSHLAISLAFLNIDLLKHRKKKKTAANVVLCDVAIIQHGISTPESHTVSRYMHKCNFIYAHKKSAAFSAPIFAKLTNAQKHYAQISYTEFHPHRKINVEKYG